MMAPYFKKKIFILGIVILYIYFVYNSDYAYGPGCVLIVGGGEIRIINEVNIQNIYFG
jgi:hypothetical protein